MILIPNKDKKFSQTNLSDTSGNIWYTKNINFDETGYMQLSSRAVSLYSAEEGTYFSYPLSIGRYDTTGKAYVVTAGATDHTYDIDLTNGAVTVNGDNTTGGNRPTGSNNNRGVWWQNKWHVTYNTGMVTNSSGTWADTGISLTTGYPHPLEVFKTRATLCVGNKNVVKQYTTAYAGSTSDLTLPSDYNVIGLAHSGEKMGIATRIDSSIIGQSQEAIFATWDGLQGSANAVYPVGSNAILGIKAYKSSWVILTKNGKLLYFNGGGFDTLATLPYFFKKLYPTDELYGDILHVEGDLIYINVSGDLGYYGYKQERFLQNYNGGILCYDPKIGLYHRYSPSISKIYAISVSSVDTSSDIMTASGTIPSTGNPALYTYNTSSVIGGLTVGKLYYIIKHTSTTFSLATTYQNAIDGVKIDLTSSTTGTFLGLAVTDYGASQGVYGLSLTNWGGQGFNFDHLVFGGNYYNVSESPKEILNITVPMFPNRGYFVTPKIESSQVDDNAQALYIKYKELKDSDSIIIKHKSKDVIGLPVSIFQRGLTFNWTSSTTGTTTADLSEAYTYMQDSNNSCEMEIIHGAGAGQMPQISSIEYSGGTYTITLSEAVEGVSSGNQCGIIIDNWKVFRTITSADSNGWVQIPIARTSKWHKFKVELRGVKTTIEELQVVNKVNTPST
jgi:hypothetical protein